MNEDNPYSSPKERASSESTTLLLLHAKQIIVHLLGYGALITFASCLVYAAKRYHSVYAWAHRQGRNISPEQFYQSANNANNAILLVAGVAIFFVVRGNYKPGKYIGGLCIVCCLIIFVHGCGHVGTRH